MYVFEVGVCLVVVVCYQVGLQFFVVFQLYIVCCVFVGQIVVYQYFVYVGVVVDGFVEFFKFLYQFVYQCFGVVYCVVDVLGFFDEVNYCVDGGYVQWIVVDEQCFEGKDLLQFV